MADVNLLPQELKPDKSVLKLSSKLKRIILIGYAVFFVAGGVAGGVYFILGQRIEDSKQRREDLKRVISSLSETEQRLVLVQDRLAVIDEIKNEENAKEEVDVLKDMVNLNVEGATLQGSEFEEGKIVIEFNAADSGVLTSILANIIGRDYSQVKLNSLSYTQAQRYDLELQIVKE